DDDAHHHAAGRERHVDDDDAGAGGDVTRSKPELETQIDHRDDLAAQVQDTLDVRRYLRHLGDVHHLDDLAYAEDRQPVFLVGEREGQILPGELRSRSDVRCVSVHALSYAATRF